MAADSAGPYQAAGKARSKGRMTDSIAGPRSRISLNQSVRIASNKGSHWTKLSVCDSEAFGVNWQVMQVKEHMKEKIVPSLLFVGKNFGKAKEAIDHYLSVFPDSKITMMNKAGDAPQYNNPEAVMYASFTLCGEPFTIMDGPGEHKYTFTEGTSFVVHCESQKEIDKYWNKLTAVKESEQCGWLKDTFGVSWQIVPKEMVELINSKDPAKNERAMAAMLQMKKLDVAALKSAFDAA